ncbi:TetR/AcrR family transcriptional regulator [Krasilnikovia sp. M28-CT-15]|uniref:TetR/AcrR family transcriptional regulator n=1 Tax=Krasilnikovia sp. M28-CT-15 TaxID=3373540 RepID=UPI003875E59C
MTQRIDGRTARAERTRNAIVDAHVELILGGELRPTADRIAKLAGVSLRALWSHFTDMEALFAASGQRILEQRDAAFEPIPPDLPLARRIEAFGRQRARLLEQVAPAAKAASLKEPFSPALQSNRRAHVDRVRDELRTLFAPELAAAGDTGPDMLTALVGVSMWPTWGTWRDAMGLDPEQARAALTRTIAALLTA